MMPQATKTDDRHRHLRPTLNSDGQRHPAINALTVFTFIAGILAFALGIIVRTHLPATILGAVGFGTGMFAQLISATTEQRIVIMAGVIAAFVGLGLGVAHGGLG
jgi:hypothetical protein